MPNNRAIKYMKQKLTELKREIDKPTFVVRDYNTSVSIIDRTTKQNQQEYRIT